MFDSTELYSRVKRYYELVDEGDVSGLLELFAPDAVYERPGYPPFKGRGQLEAFYSGDRVIVDGKHTLRHVVAGSDTVATHGDFAGVLKDGSEVSLRFADFFVVADDGRFSRRDTFFFSPMV